MQVTDEVHQLSDQQMGARSWLFNKFVDPSSEQSYTLQCKAAPSSEATQTALDVKLASGQLMHMTARAYTGARAERACARVGHDKWSVALTNATSMMELVRLNYTVRNGYQLLGELLASLISLRHDLSAKAIYRACWCSSAPCSHHAGTSRR